MEKKNYSGVHFNDLIHMLDNLIPILTSILQQLSIDIQQKCNDVVRLTLIKTNH